MLCSLLFFAPLTAQQRISIGSVTQRATCAVTGVIGNVTINCPGVDHAAIVALERQFNARLKDRDLTVDKMRTEANEWRDKYTDLVERLAKYDLTDSSRRKIKKFVDIGKLDQAGQLLDELLSSEDVELETIAQDNFERARLFELNFQPVEALARYAKAWNIRSDRPDYGYAYGLLLANRGDYESADAILSKTLDLERELEKTDYFPHALQIVKILEARARAKTAVKRFPAAESDGLEALNLIRQLAKSDAGLATGVNRALAVLGVVYTFADKLTQADDAYKQSLAAQKLITNPTATRQEDLAATLTGIGLLYLRMDDEKWNFKESDQNNPEAFMAHIDRVFKGWSTEAIMHLEEARDIRRNLTKSKRKVYEGDLAGTLLLLGEAYRRHHFIDAAIRSLVEAADIYRESSVTDSRYELSLVYSLALLGDAYRGNKDLDKARDSYLAAIKVQNRPTANPETGASLYEQLAMISHQDKRPDDADKYWAEAIRIRRMAAGISDIAKVNLATTLTSAAEMYAEANRPDRALTNYSEALTVFKGLADSGSTDYAEKYLDLLGDVSRLYLKLERWNEAIELYSDGVPFLKRLASKDPAEYDELIEVLVELSELYRKVGQPIKAADACSEALMTLRDRNSSEKLSCVTQ